MLAFLIWMGIGIMLATFAVPLLAGLYWRGATRMGALTSMSAGLISAGIFGGYYQYIDKLPLHFSFYAFVVSAITMIIVSLMTKKNDEKVLDETRTGWYIHAPRK
jgi:SSS family solute:Na+ symporter